MKKRLIVITAMIAVVIMLCVTAGCSLLGNNTDNIANSGGSSSSGTTTNTTRAADYSSLTRDELETMLTKYVDICDKQADLLDSYKQIVEEAVANRETNIGTYASTLVDCVMNLTCVEPQYTNVGCQGSGFIITEDGYVITNNHVVYYEAEVYEPISSGWITRYNIRRVTGVYSSITAVFDSESSYYGNGTVYNLEFVYRDPDYDLALLKIVEEVPTGDKWSAVPFYDGTTKRGDEVLVLGNADGKGLSATAGIVSATGKTFTDSPKLTFIQTDAAINGGNSGGPAVNIYGALIGVVNSKFVSTSIENMGFAIELEKVETFIRDAVADATSKGTPITVNYTTKGDAPTNVPATEEQQAA